MFYSGEYKIWWKLKRLEAQFDFLNSRVSALSSRVEGFADQQLYEGVSDPNTVAFKPNNLTIPAQYVQYIAGVPVHNWYWNVSGQQWY